MKSPTETPLTAATIVVSVILPWCGEKEIEESLKILGSAPWMEILVVDNRREASTRPVSDRNVKWLREKVPGAAAARNRGIGEAQGEFLFFMDSDCIPEADWVQRMLQQMRDTGADGIQGPILSRQTHPVARYIQAEFEQRQSRLAAHGEIALISSGNCAYRRQVLMEAKGFDTSLIAGEDTELAFRLRARGYRLLYVTSPAVWHRHPTRILSLLRRKYRYAFYLARIYRRYHGRIAENTRTPRTQLMAIGLWFLLLPGLLYFGPKGGLAILGALLATSVPLCLKSGPIALLLSPLSTLMNTVGLISGLFRLWIKKP